MTPNRNRLETRQRDVIGRFAARLLRDDSGVTSLRYFITVVSLALVLVAAARPIACILASFLYRAHVIATLAIPQL